MQPDIPSPQPNVRMALLVAAVALVASLGMAFVIFRAQSLAASPDDAYHFVQLGTYLAHGEGFRDAGIVLRRRGPLYPLFIGGTLALFGDRPGVVLFLQCLLYTLTCVLVFDTGRRVFSERVGLTAGVLCALHPVMLRYVGDFQVETLLTFWFTATVWVSVLFAERPSVRNAVLFGALCAFASLTKPVVLGYPFVFVVYWFLTGRRDGRTSVAGQPRPQIVAMVSLISLAAIIAPWTIRNYIVTGGHFVPVTTGLSDAVLRGYVFSRSEFALLRLPPYTYAENESNAMFRAICAREGFEWEKDDIQTDKALNRAMVQRIETDPGGFVRKFAVGLFTFWYQMTSRTNSIVAGVPALICWVLAWIGWRRGRANHHRLWLVMLPVIYLNVVLALLLALGRYSAPVVPCLVLAAAYGIDILRSGRTAGAPTGAS